MLVLRLLHRFQNQGRIGRCVLGLELSQLLKTSGIRNHRGVTLQLL
jgi:hypothetical protein